MKNSNRKIQNLRYVAIVLCVACGFWQARAQSINQNYPTPITANEITGKIAARDLGDARLTNYYYVFGGAQGDVFINLKTSNLDGDFDIFTADNLRPLTKITVFSDAPASETGRIIYLRKPEKLILRIQGRSPNEQPAIFNLKFAGSFTPALAIAGNQLPELPELKIENQTDARVNSVGTIIEVKPTPTARPAETIAENEPEKNLEKETVETEPQKIDAAETTTAVKPKRKPGRKSGAKPKPVVAPDAALGNETAVNNPPEKSVPSKNKRRVGNRTSAVKAEKPKIAGEPNPLENVRLSILLKDGTKIERPMSEVLRVGVIKGVLTLVSKNGAINRYSILDVAKMTIE